MVIANQGDATRTHADKHPQGELHLKRFNGAEACGTTPYPVTATITHNTMTEVPTSTRVWFLQNQALDAISLSGPSSTFALKNESLPSTVPADSLLVKTLFLSNDPGQRVWIQKTDNVARQNIPVIPIGEPMTVLTLCRVLRVGGEDSLFKVGDLVNTLSPWAEYSVVKKAASKVVK